MNHQTAIGARMKRRWPLLLTFSTFAAMLFLVPTAQADHIRHRTIWYGGGSQNNVYQSCDQPSWEEIEFDRGFQAGLRDGRRQGYADGRNC